MIIELDVDVLQANNTLSGAGTVIDPLRVSNPGITQVIVDETLQGNGTLADPLSVSTVGIVGIIVKEVDGIPTVNDVTILRVPNGSLTNDGGGQVTFTPAGGGGSPGGNDKNVQVNNAGAFAGYDTLNFDSNTNSLIVDDASLPNDSPTGGKVTGGTSNLNITTDDNGESFGSTGLIFIGAGSTSNPANNVYGGHTVVHAGVGSSVSAGDGRMGNLYLVPDIVSNGIPSDPFYGGSIIGIANNVTYGLPAGGIYYQSGISSGRQSASVTVNPATVAVSPFPALFGDMIFATGLNGVTRGNFQIPTGCLVIGSNIATSSNTTKSIILSDTTDPSSSTAGAGILYVSGGALKFRGSSGTVTTIAPA